MDDINNVRNYNVRHHLGISLPEEMIQLGLSSFTCLTHFNNVAIWTATNDQSFTAIVQHIGQYTEKLGALALGVETNNLKRFGVNYRNTEKLFEEPVVSVLLTTSSDLEAWTNNKLPPTITKLEKKNKLHNDLYI